MIRLKLKNAKALINSFNPRAELHGEETRLAGDIFVTVPTNADNLEAFAPDLKSFLFDPKALKDLADGSPLRFPAIPSIKWNDEMTGAGFELHVGAGDPVSFNDAKVDKFRIEPVAGGSAKISFRVIVHPTEAQAGRLASFIQAEVEISLVPPELPVLADGGAEEKKPAKKTGKDAAGDQGGEE